MFFENASQTADAPALPNQPLAARLRPHSFDEYAGQTHIIGPGKLLRRAIEADRFTAIILYGPPGVGKTSLAELIATLTLSHFVRLSAVNASVADVRKAIAEAVARRRLRDGERTVLFIDEIHRFSRAQQDVLLPDVENGNVRLIGCTTENPFFCVVGPLVSRAQIFHLEPLSVPDAVSLMRRAIVHPSGFPGVTVELADDAATFLGERCEGDARRALTALEIAVYSTPAGNDGRIHIDLAVAEESLQQKALSYGDDGHYDTASAFIKSLRGSDVNAAVYWLAKMLQAGEDIRFIARRLVIFASEDVGNADPRALSLATSAMQAVQMIGMPEARIILSQAVTYCATCPKSNASMLAIDKALDDVRHNRVQPVPAYLRDGHYAGAKRLGSGIGYQYAHDAPDGVADQDYLEVPASYYEPKGLGYEKRIRERLDWWAARRREQKHAREGREPSDARAGQGGSARRDTREVPAEGPGEMPGVEEDDHG